MDNENILQNLVRIGTVSSVDPVKRTARVIFKDRDNLVSGELKVLQNQPLITIEKWVTEEGAENKWNCSARYASADRKLGLGESYTKAAPDVISNSKTIKYEKTEGIPQPAPSCPLTGVIENKSHRQTVTVYPWLPYIGQLVLCIYLPVFNGDGFVLGGI